MIDSEFKNNLLEFLASNPHINRLCVAYSGGLDSSVLLSLCHDFCQAYELSPSKKLSLKALHVHHGLSLNADAWETHCKKTCVSYSSEFISKKVTLDKSINIEKKAREKRYQFFEEQCTEHDVLLMAHHLNDQSETLLFRFFRGNSSKALAGIPQQRALNKSSSTQLLRPLLNVSKAQLHEYAVQKGLTWVEDESNCDKKYARNFIRNDLLPNIREHWPEVDKNLSRSARFFSETESLLSDLATIDLLNLLNQHETLKRWGDSLDIKKFQGLSIERKKNCLRFWMDGKNVDLPPENRLLKLISFAEDLERESAGELSWKQDDCEVVFRVFEECLFFHINPLEKAECKNFQWDLKVQDYFDCDVYRYSATAALKDKVDFVDVRFREGGERCQPLGRAHSQSLKKLFQEYQIPAWERDSAPLFYVGDVIVAVADFWVCEGFLPKDEQKGLCLIERVRI